MSSCMPEPTIPTDRRDLRQVARFLANGCVAAGFHFALLYINLFLLGMSSAGMANFCAALGGITVSFLGCRYFVFRASGQPILSQATRFGGLYVLTALLHGAVLYAWTDLAGYDYRLGFLLATAMQVVLSYFGNKNLIFHEQAIH